ncbi:hypothetical protein HAX54_015716 [Datura stramonium]|uniref:Uncharacterized protein n=1 Tax=Datura stramonium TaxID=4076 RepID=A0ABS8UHK6_DATST|nr:hypothetical protein [Datura stramonium]
MGLPLCSPRTYCQALVREFYTSYGANLQATKPRLWSFVEPLQFVRVTDISKMRDEALIIAPRNPKASVQVGLERDSGWTEILILRADLEETRAAVLELQIRGPTPPQAQGKMPLWEEEAKTNEEDLQKEVDPDMEVAEAASIKATKLESLSLARIMTHIDSKVGISTNFIPTTPTFIPNIISHGLD